MSINNRQIFKTELVLYRKTELSNVVIDIFRPQKFEDQVLTSGTFVTAALVSIVDFTEILISMACGLVRN